MQFLSLLSFTSLYAFPKPVKRSAFVDNRPRARQGRSEYPLSPFFYGLPLWPNENEEKKNRLLTLAPKSVNRHSSRYLTPWLGFSILRRENEMLWSRQKVKKRICLCSHPYFPLQLGSYIPSPSSIQN